MLTSADANKVFSTDAETDIEAQSQMELLVNPMRWTMSLLSKWVMMGGNPTKG